MIWALGYHSLWYGQLHREMFCLSNTTLCILLCIPNCGIFPVYLCKIDSSCLKCGKIIHWRILLRFYRPSKSFVSAVDVLIRPFQIHIAYQCIGSVRPFLFAHVQDGFTQEHLLIVWRSRGQNTINKKTTTTTNNNKNNNLNVFPSTSQRGFPA